MTALTAQNTTGVQGIHPVPPEFVEKQVRLITPVNSLWTLKLAVD